MNTVNILGTKYEIIMDAPEELMPDNADGAMDQSLRRILVAKLEANINSIQDMNSYRKKVLRHEIIHAFFYESGLWNNSGSTDAWGQDETICDWIAIQSPKIFQAFKEAKCI